MKHHRELENLTLTTQPLKTLKYFAAAIGQYVRQFMAKGGWYVLLIMLAGGIGMVSMTIGGPHEKVLTFRHAFFFFTFAVRLLVKVVGISCRLDNMICL